jgi:hypothetical protein
MIGKETARMKECTGANVIDFYSTAADDFVRGIRFERVDTVQETPRANNIIIVHDEEVFGASLIESSFNADIS